MQVLLARHPTAFGKRLIEIPAEFNDGCSKCAHGGVLICRVAVRDIDRRRNTRVRGRKRDGLAMIAPGGRDDPGHFCRWTLQIVHVDDAAAHLECASRGVVLMLHPHFAPSPPGEKWPGILRRWWHRTVHKLRRSVQFGEGEKQGG